MFTNDNCLVPTDTIPFQKRTGARTVAKASVEAGRTQSSSLSQVPPTPLSFLSQAAAWHLGKLCPKPGWQAVPSWDSAPPPKILHSLRLCEHSYSGLAGRCVTEVLGLKIQDLDRDVSDLESPS